MDQHAKKRIIVLSGILSVAALFFAVNAVMAFWAGPTNSPPGGPFAPFVDTGGATQWKSGSLGVGDPAAGGFEVSGGSGQIQYMSNNNSIGSIQYQNTGISTGTWSFFPSLSAGGLSAQSLTIVTSSPFYLNGIFDGSKWVPDGSSMTCSSPTGGGTMLVGEAKVASGTVEVDVSYTDASGNVMTTTGFQPWYAKGSVNPNSMTVTFGPAVYPGPSGYPPTFGAESQMTALLMDLNNSVMTECTQSF